MTNKTIYYVYAYLRSKDSISAKAGTPYYIGKGKENRAFSKNHTAPLPKEKSKIVFLETNLTEIGAFALERRYIEWYGCKYDSTGILHNRTKGGEGQSGNVIVKDKEGKISSVSLNDPKFISRELVGIRHGTTRVKDKSGRVFTVKCDDQRYLSGELIHANCGNKGTEKQKLAVSLASRETVPVITLNGTKMRVPIDDINYLNGNSKHVATKDILIKTSDGTNKWISKRSEILDSSIIWENKASTKFIFITPWGRYESAGIASRNSPYHDIGLQQIKKWCKSNLIITPKHRILLSIYGSEIIGKTTSDLGFLRIKK